MTNSWICLLRILYTLPKAMIYTLYTQCVLHIKCVLHIYYLLYYTCITNTEHIINIIIIYIYTLYVTFWAPYFLLHSLILRSLCVTQGGQREKPLEAIDWLWLFSCANLNNTLSLINECAFSHINRRLRATYWAHTFPLIFKPYRGLNYSFL